MEKPQFRIDKFLERLHGDQEESIRKSAFESFKEILQVFEDISLIKQESMVVQEIPEHFACEEVEKGAKLFLHITLIYLLINAKRHNRTIHPFLNAYLEELGVNPDEIQVEVID